MVLELDDPLSHPQSDHTPDVQSWTGGGLRVPTLDDLRPENMFTSVGMSSPYKTVSYGLSQAQPKF